MYENARRSQFSKIFFHIVFLYQEVPSAIQTRVWMAAHAERKKPMTQTKKSGGVNVQRDTMENIVMVRNSEGLVYHILCTAAPSPPPRRFFFFGRGGGDRGCGYTQTKCLSNPSEKIFFSFSVLVTSLMNLSHADLLHALFLNPWLRTCLHKVSLHNHWWKEKRKLAANIRHLINRFIFLLWHRNIVITARYCVLKDGNSDNVHLLGMKPNRVRHAFFLTFKSSIFILKWPASTQVYCDKKKNRLHEKRLIRPQD